MSRLALASLTYEGRSYVTCTEISLLACDAAAGRRAQLLPSRISSYPMPRRYSYRSSRAANAVDRARSPSPPVTTVRVRGLDPAACDLLADRCVAAAARRELAGHLPCVPQLWRATVACHWEGVAGHAAALRRLRKFNTKCVPSQLILLAKNSGSEESLAVDAARFCVRHFPPGAPACPT